MPRHHKIDYVEFPCCDFQRTKDFFSTVFGWTYVDYSPEYAAIQNAGIEGGFYASDACSRTTQGAMIVIFYSTDLEATQHSIVNAGGTIIEETFSFPGGRRFHFTEPSGNEFAVWSDK